MFHNDIMYAVMQERARELRAEAAAHRRSAEARRAREYWAAQAVRMVPRRARRVRGDGRVHGTAATGN